MNSKEPCNNGEDCLIQPLLTDLYQLTMCYGYWKAKKHTVSSVFDLFFRKNPFQGEFTIFCGLEDCIRYIQNFHFSDSDIDYLRTVFPKSTEEAFFQYLKSIDCSQVRILALPEGSVVFPKLPLITVEGPLAICQLLETTLLNLVNFSSLVCTNAVRFRIAAGRKAVLLEFGLRRAQGPNGGLSASKYCYIGGFNGTSNVLAGKRFGIPVKGTHAHAFVNSFSANENLEMRTLDSLDGSKKDVDFYDLSSQCLDELLSKCDLGVVQSEVNRGELTAFCAYAIAFPTGFLALIDTYDVLRSGVINFCACAIALWRLGYKSVGLRIDSGDLAYLSKEVREILKKVAERFQIPWLAEVLIVASNDINEDTIYSLNEQEHSINCYGVGTHLVTCQKQPALGCVFKRIEEFPDTLVSVGGTPCIKLSEEVEKLTIPGKKRGYRLFGKTGHAILDLMALEEEPAPQKGQQILCRHPFVEKKRAYVTPAKVIPLHVLYWGDGQVKETFPPLIDVKQNVVDSMATLRQDHKRHLNPTPYKVSVTEKLYDFLHSLWLQNAPIGELA